MSSQYIFDKDDIKFRKKRTSVWAVLRKILVFFVSTLSMAVLYYLIFALFFSTEQQQRLRDEAAAREESALRSLDDARKNRLNLFDGDEHKHPSGCDCGCC